MRMTRVVAGEAVERPINKRYRSVLIFSERERRLKLSVFRHCVAVDWRKSRAVLIPNRTGRVEAFYRFGDK